MKFLYSLLSEETLKELDEMLGEDLVKQVDEKLGEYKVNAGKEKLIPKNVYDTDKAELKKQIDDRDTQLKDLLEKVKDSDNLTLQIKNLQDANAQSKADYEKRLSEQSQRFAFEKVLSGAKSKNVKALEGLIDKSKLVYKESNGDYEIEGLKDQIEALKKSDAYLFEGNVPTTPNPQNHNNLNTAPHPSQDSQLRAMFGLGEVKEN